MNENQISTDTSINSKDNIIYSVDKRLRFLLPIIGIGIILVLATLALAAATLAIVNNRLKETTTTTTSPSLGSEYAESIKISDVMVHLNELQRIATISNGTRAVNKPGFNLTLDYISDYVLSYTNFKLTKSYFPVRYFNLASVPILLTSVNGVITNHTFSTTLTASEFYFVQYTRSANFTDYVPISVVPNLGCSDADWIAASPPVSGRVALVQRGDCTFGEKAILASKYNVAGVLFYNDGTSSDRIPPIYITLGQTNELRALFLSYTLGKALADAAQNPSNNVGVRMIISFADESTVSVGNICADTPTGDNTQTIVIGSHSDGVPAGPGINDNGKLQY
jgi:hypothetical protein